MVIRRRMYQAKRKRPRVLRVWLGRVRLDFRIDRRRQWILVGLAFMVEHQEGRRAGPTQEVVMPKKPAGSTGTAGPSPVAAKRCKFLSATPTVASYLTDTEYEEGGGHREPSYLMIRPGAGVWAATLKDPTEKRQVRVVVDTFSAILPALEALLQSEVCPWEPDKWAEERSPKKKK